MTLAARYDLIAFDVDGTLVDDTVFVWQTLHDYFHTDPESRDMAFKNYMAGKWKYQQWFEHDMKLLTEAGADRESMLKAIEGMTLMKGTYEVLEELRRGGARLVIISGSLNLVSEKFGLEPYFDAIFLNWIGFDDSGKLAEWKATPYDVWDKATGLRELAARWEIPMEKTAFIGDNFNDVAVAQAAGFSIAFNCKSDKLAQVADAVVPGNDLSRILPFLLK